MGSNFSLWLHIHDGLDAQPAQVQWILGDSSVKLILLFGEIL
jgi:hypothetical protein